MNLSLRALLLLAAVAPLAIAATTADRDDEKIDAQALRIDRGEGRLPIFIALDEELVFVSKIHLGVVGAPTVGHLTITSKTEPYNSGVLIGGGIDPERRTGTIDARIRGGYLGYRVREQITTTHLPQAWPALIFRSTQTGSENRKHELMLGTRNGKDAAQHRADRHCKSCERLGHFVEGLWPWQEPHHCRKCKRAEHRVWRDPKTREVPEGTLDMLSAVLLARSMVSENRLAARFEMLDELKLWDVRLSRGTHKRLDLPAGEFDAVKVELVTRVPKGEDREEDEFSGLFGIHGTIEIWVHQGTGVPLLIYGEIPAGPLDIAVSIELESYRGTPPAFEPRG